MTTWLVGVDAGGTRTRALALNAETGEARRAEGPGANWTVHGPATCGERLADVVAQVLPPDARPAAICLAVAGYYPPDHSQQATLWAAHAWPDARVEIVPDMVAAWAGAHNGEPGIIVIAGTGSIAYGRNAEGQEARSGGWGPLFGDGGSAYGVGVAALRTLAALVDGIAPETQLSEQFLRRWPELGKDLRAWLRGVYRHGWGREEIAGLAQVVATAAEEGDAVAHSLLVDAGRELAVLAVGVERRLDLSPGPSPTGRGGPTPLQVGGLPPVPPSPSGRDIRGLSVSELSPRPLSDAERGAYPASGSSSATGPPFPRREGGQEVRFNPAALLGGLGEGSPILRDAFTTSLRDAGSDLQLISPLRTAVEGALLLAAEEWGGDAARRTVADRLDAAAEVRE
jgi:N-acetylglucosamine kinase-like BadF-type ATPase